MALPGHEFLTAHFSDNERTNVEVYWVTPDGLETRVENILISFTIPFLGNC